MVSLICCGPKLSICCTLLSIWGFIMLAIMGGLLQVKSLTFAEDILKDEEADNYTAFMEIADKKYSDASYTCFVAAIIYVITFFWSLWQAFMNKKAGNI